MTAVIGVDVRGTEVAAGVVDDPGGLTDQA
jgi:predicted NBD/HSP70 family sugar kinase